MNYDIASITQAYPDCTIRVWDKTTNYPELMEIKAVGLYGQNLDIDCCRIPAPPDSRIPVGWRVVADTCIPFMTLSREAVYLWALRGDCAELIHSAYLRYILGMYCGHPDLGRINNAAIRDLFFLLRDSKLIVVRAI